MYTLQIRLGGTREDIWDVDARCYGGILSVLQYVRNRTMMSRSVISGPDTLSVDIKPLLPVLRESRTNLVGGDSVCSV